MKADYARAIGFGAINGLAAATVWTDGSGVAIPKSGTPERLRFDATLQRKYGRSKPMKVPMRARNVRYGNPVTNTSRYMMYQQMAQAEGVLPPILVKRDAEGVVIVDGNHRYAAAAAVGLAEIDAFVVD